VVRKHQRKRLLGRPKLRGRIILKYVFKKKGWGAWNELTWLRIGTGG